MKMFEVIFCVEGFFSVSCSRVCAFQSTQKIPFISTDLRSGMFILKISAVFSKQIYSIPIYLPLQMDFVAFHPGIFYTRSYRRPCLFCLKNVACMGKSNGDCNA